MFIKIVRLARDWKVIEGSKGKFAVNTVWWKNWRDESIFLDIILFNPKRVETITKYTKKGSKLQLIGEIETKSYDAKCKSCSEPHKVTSHQLNVTQFEFLDTRDSSYEDVAEMDNTGRKTEIVKAKPVTEIEDMFTNTKSTDLNIGDDDSPF